MKKISCPQDTPINLNQIFPLEIIIPNSGIKQITEHKDWPVLRSGSLMLDGLFALAVEEKNDLKIERLGSTNFKPEPCSCFKTGRKWTYVWTRDVAYAANLSLAFFEPTRSMNTLSFKISKGRNTGGESYTEIIQDLGSGGSWPISTDRVTWALGADEILKNLTGQERQAFLEKGFFAMASTIDRDRKTIFDSVDGLYRGEQSFLDWREQTYPKWASHHVLEVGMSKALSTNIAHYTILDVASQWAIELNQFEKAELFNKWKRDLKEKINLSFWNEKRGMYRTLISYINSGIEDNRYDLLGNSLAVLKNIANTDQTKSIIENYPHTSAGPPVIFPQLPDVPIYHNRGIWPFVTSYNLLAAKKIQNAKVVNSNFLSLIRGSALNLSNMENYEFLTQHNYYSEGKLSGPVVNSQAQLWSVAGFLSAFVDVFLERNKVTTLSDSHHLSPRKFANSFFLKKNPFLLII